MVYFRHNDVLVTGDVFTTTGYPVIDLERGGSINGVVDALNQILDIAFPDFRLEGGTLIVPGHGRLCDSADVAYYRDMVTIVRDRVQDMIKKGMTLDQVKAARPTRDYDPRYGRRRAVDDRHVRRGGLQEPQREAMKAVRAAPIGAALAVMQASRGSACSVLLAPLLAQASPAHNAAQPRARPRAGRSHRLLGERRDRGLALSDGDAGAGRPSERAAQRRGQRASRTAWDPAKDEAAGEQCRAYGAAGVMRAPGRLHITWQDDSDAEDRDGSGHADAAVALRRRRAAGLTRRPHGRASSAAQWEFAGGARGGRGGAGGRGGNLKVVTTRMRPGYLQKNGVPYGAQRGADRVLQPHVRAKRRLVADSHVDRRGSAVFDRPLHPQHALQAVAGHQHGVGTGAVLGAISSSSAAARWLES